MHNISDYMYGNRHFQKSYVKENNQKLEELAQKGQTPHALFIGCVDSRVLPNLITDTGPGDMLIVRNVGNFVPPCDESTQDKSVASALEFAVKVLGVKEIIVCGHTQCGAIYTIYSDLDVESFPHLASWLKQGDRLRSRIKVAEGTFKSKELLLRRAEQVSVQLQLENLLTYPFVRDAVENGEVSLHGWIYDIQSGKISSYDQKQERFVSVDEIVPGSVK